eukprot:CAMPEP_0202477054 /NCGR_PEP_ID=MMETSP1360-20130828/93745_1 /ASSEMBLY_ACC=CAM_ASM_000848 /TAXON_ID=515479 /ORGANISM="Licmophora paradoxa, Strain CCMP2313" /LENGTH=292 /DNA_ID=CAMNT_0049104285 /DNA_START=207 /DNA_END=1085 /DNA_ORIENTATION=+
MELLKPPLVEHRHSLCHGKAYNDDMSIISHHTCGTVGSDASTVVISNKSFMNVRSTNMDSTVLDQQECERIIDYLLRPLPLVLETQFWSLFTMQNVRSTNMDSTVLDQQECERIIDYLLRPLPLVYQFGLLATLSNRVFVQGRSYSDNVVANLDRLLNGIYYLESVPEEQVPDFAEVLRVSESNFEMMQHILDQRQTTAMVAVLGVHEIRANEGSVFPANGGNGMPGAVLPTRVHDNHDNQSDGVSDLTDEILLRQHGAVNDLAVLAGAAAENDAEEGEEVDEIGLHISGDS